MKNSTLKSRKGGCLFKLLKLFIFVVIVLAVAIYFSLGYIADYALKTVTAGTGINAGLSSMSIMPSEQKVQVGNFFITNPPNFKQCDAIAFKEAVLDADISLSDVLSKRLIVLDEIKVVGLKMNIDIKTGAGLSALVSAPKSNINAIQEALMAKLGETKSKQEAAEQQQGESAPSAEWKIIIKKIVFDDGSIDGSVNGKSLKVNIPSFALENIGTAKGGETPIELATDIVGQLAVVGTTNLVKAALKGGLDAGESGTDAATNAAEGAANAVGNTLKSLFGN